MSDIKYIQIFFWTICILHGISISSNCSQHVKLPIIHTRKIETLTIFYVFFIAEHLKYFSWLVFIFSLLSRLRISVTNIVNVYENSRIQPVWLNPFCLIIAYQYTYVCGNSRNIVKYKISSKKLITEHQFVTKFSIFNRLGLK